MTLIKIVRMNPAITNLSNKIIWFFRANIYRDISDEEEEQLNNDNYIIIYYVHNLLILS